MEIIRNHPTLKGKLSQPVSCHYAPPLFHAGQETFRNQFPAAMLRQCPMPDRKPFATSFLPLCSANVPCRTGNFSQIVSFRYESHCSQVGQETFRKQFPAAMLLHCFMPNEKLSANSFLSPCSTTAPCRTRNYPPIVSCRHVPPLPHAGWETIRKQLPIIMLHHCPTPDGKP